MTTPGRWVGFLLRLFPKPFRSNHRDEITEYVRAELEGAGRGRIRVIVRVGFDLIRSAFRLRLRPVRTSREVRGGLLDALQVDLRVALRGLLRRPVFTAVVVATLGLGVGLNTALFSVVHTTLLRPLDYQDPESLVYLESALPARDIEDALFSGGDLEEVRRISALVAAEGVALIRQNLHGAGLPRQVAVGWVSNGFLDLFGVELPLGRVHGVDDPPGAVVLSWALWQTAFGGSPDALGASIRLDGHPYTIIGAMPEGFRARLPWEGESPPTIELWKNPDAYWQNGDVWSAQGPEFALVQVVGRLHPEATVTDAQFGVDGLAEELRTRYPAFASDGYAITVTDLHERVTRGSEPVLWMLFGAVVAVLLIACANVAGLFLVRGQSRRREVGLRVALGSSRARIGRLLMLEGLVVAAAGTVVGVAMATTAVSAIPALAPAGFALADDLRVELPVLAFAAVTGIVVTLLVGLLPSVLAVTGDPGRDMGSQRVVDSAGGVVRRLLVVGQLAVSVVLLVGAGLLVSSMARLQAVEVGFDPADVHTFGVSIPGTQYGWPAEAGAFYREVERSVSEIRGVESVGVVWPMPFAGTWSGDHAVPDGELRRLGQVPYRLATEGYFPTMEIPLLEGRLFEDGDASDVVVVSRSVAERAWPGQSPVGRRIRANPWGPEPTDFEIVGVVGDVRYHDLREPSEGALYFDVRHWSWVDWEVHVLARSSTEASLLIPALREAVASVDPQVPVAHPAMLSEGFAVQTADTRFVMRLLGLLAGTAGVLALIGLYGVVAYAVGLRRREFGVRIALGSGRGGIRRLVVEESGRIVLAGMTLGLVGAMGLGAVLDALLFEVSTTDPKTYAGVSVVLLLGAAAACAGPAWRVGRLNPVEVLKAE